MMTVIRILDLREKKRWPSISLAKKQHRPVAPLLIRGNKHYAVTGDNNGGVHGGAWRLSLLLGQRYVFGVATKETTGRLDRGVLIMYDWHIGVIVGRTKFERMER